MVAGLGGFVKRFSPFLILIALCGQLWLPEAACAARERLIAVIMANSPPRYQQIHTVFQEKATRFCAQDCRIYLQTPNADIMSLRNSVRKAVALGADLIVTYGPLATLAAQVEVPPAPTLFVDVYDPVGLKIVSAQKRTGHNMTGVRGDAPVQALFKYFTETVEAKKVAVLFDSSSAEGALQHATLVESGQRKGIDIVSLPVTNTKDHISPLKGLTPDADGLFVANSEHDLSQLNQVMEYANQQKVPVISLRSGATDMGAFMALETSAQEQGEVLADMAEKVLSGTPVTDLPMYKPHKVDFIINLKVAKRYGINVPIQTLSVASKVVR